MAVVPIKLLGRGEVARMADQSASGGSGIDVEIQPDAPCVIDLAITKPTGAVVSVVHAYGSGAAVPKIDAADADVIAAIAIEITGIEMAQGDEIRVDIDTTSGAKALSAKARRLL
jgi:phosphotransferase system HPr-like phosphotransfer protein